MGVGPLLLLLALAAPTPEPELRLVLGAPKADLRAVETWGQVFRGVLGELQPEEWKRALSAVDIDPFDAKSWKRAGVDSGRPFELRVSRRQVLLRFHLASPKTFASALELGTDEARALGRGRDPWLIGRDGKLGFVQARYRSARPIRVRSPTIEERRSLLPPTPLERARFAGARAEGPGGNGLARFRPCGVQGRLHFDTPLALCGRDARGLATPRSDAALSMSGCIAPDILSTLEVPGMGSVFALPLDGRMRVELSREGALELGLGLTAAPTGFEAPKGATLERDKRHLRLRWGPADPAASSARLARHGLSLRADPSMLAAALARVPLPWGPLLWGIPPSWKRSAGLLSRLELRTKTSKIVQFDLEHRLGDSCETTSRDSSHRAP